MTNKDANSAAPDQTNAEVSDERLRELLPCPLFSEDMPHEVRMDETVSGRALRYVITCSCGLVFNGPYADVGSEVAPGNAKKWTIAAWNRRSVTSQASEGEAEPVAWRCFDEGSWMVDTERHTDWEPLYASPSKRVERLEAALRNALPAYEDWMDDHADGVKSATCRQLTFGEIRAAYALLQALQGGRS